jgi:hypothetical protein
MYEDSRTVPNQKGYMWTCVVWDDAGSPRDGGNKLRIPLYINPIDLRIG